MLSNQDACNTVLAVLQLFLPACCPSMDVTSLFLRQRKLRLSNVAFVCAAD
jgi:hypothetical protein